MGRETYENIATWIIDHLKTMPDGDRERAMDLVAARFCRHCWAEYSDRNPRPCHCTNDE